MFYCRRNSYERDQSIWGVGHVNRQHRKKYSQSSQVFFSFAQVFCYRHIHLLVQSHFCLHTEVYHMAVFVLYN